VDEFLAAACGDRQACVVSDIRMPGRDALELPKCLAEAGRYTPVVFLTAYDTPENREAARRVGATAYLRKPVDDQALLDAVAWALSAPGNRRC
jgi:FixJ family two-component response regulator